MLKKRIIAALTIKDGLVVQSMEFNRYLPVGSPEICVEFLNKWGIDEIALLDIEATSQKRRINFNLVTEVSKKSFVPLTVGGGIKNLEDIRKLVYFGADKVSINKATIENPQIIKEGAEIFGNQCIVVSMDVKKINGHYKVYTDSGKNPTELEPVKWAKEVERLGAGEILLNSIDKDGAKSGYDLNIIRRVAGAVSIPVIACGGAGHPKHFYQAFAEGGVSAAAAGNFFHFTEHSSILVKAFLRNNNVDVRVNTYVDYESSEFDSDGRLLKKPDQYLEKIRFEYQPEETI